ncbi:MAG: segregation ATPase FtsK/SpoIIIE, family [Solirubrobacteraceae bacterium]|jgi:S-DNA-T family DNA segregation ATPase FtsK/SpoIIIE|nr:segregation ATPase FtsK/SpoIIIE, family [Solirubrobacteraceae bacterium]
MPARKKPQPKRRARRSRPAPILRRPRAPQLEPHELDLVGLGLAALGLFLALVVYFGVAGGEVGRGVALGLRFGIGMLAYAVPAALVVAGALVLGRTALPAARPLRTGALCLAAALLLALAAGTLGLGLGGHRPSWARHALEGRGGVVGEAFYWAVSHLVSSVGAHILAAFLLLAGLILVTGASVATIMRLTGARVAHTGRRLRASAPRPTAMRRPRPDAHEPATARIEPPDPPTEEFVVRAGEDPNGVAELPEWEGDPEPAEFVPETDPAPAVDASDLTPQGRYRPSVTDDPSFPWRLPEARLLTRSSAEQARPDTAGQSQTSAQLVAALGHFSIEAKVVGTVAGPHITRYELRLAPGTKVSKVANLKDDLAYALAATDIRILAPIPGKQAVGVEVPNARRRMVHLGDVYRDPPPDWSPLTVWLGKDVAGNAIGADLAKMPHLLVAGTTGAGKSGAINAMLASILLRADPHQVRLVLVDPKQVELNHYDAIPHLLTPVITSPRMAANALQNLVKEMEERYGLMSLARTRSLTELNRAREARDEPALPYVLCVIDELADLMMVAPADVEDSIIRLAQKARAVGIHLVLATQSPRVDVITGMIKANVPSRIAFAVSSQTDSRVILDQNGAETLLGQGDMLFSPVGTSRLERIQGAYVDEGQIAALTEWWRRQGEPEFHEELLEEVVEDAHAGSGDDDEGFSPDEDPLLEEAIGLVAQMGTASTSMLQRRLRLGYTRAGRLIDMLERRGIISGYEGSKPRQVLIGEADVPRVLLHLSEAGAAGPAPSPQPVGAESPGGEPE